jgi:hypothetical protein
MQDSRAIVQQLIDERVEAARSFLDAYATLSLEQILAIEAGASDQEVAYAKEIGESTEERVATHPLSPAWFKAFEDLNEEQARARALRYQVRDALPEEGYARQVRFDRITKLFFGVEVSVTWEDFFAPEVIKRLRAPWMRVVGSTHPLPTS